MAVLPTGIGPVTGYNVERSLRFNSADSAYLNRTPASAGNRKTWTWSGWVKKTVNTTTTPPPRILGAGTASTGETGITLGGDSIEVYRYASAYTFQLVTTAKFRDNSAWYHLVVSYDTSEATSSNRVKIYVNGIQQTSFSTANYPPTLNAEYEVNNTVNHRIGHINGGGASNYLNGYLTEVNFIDGSALTPSSFGETDSATGVWKPKAYTGTYGTNGFELNFSDNSNNTAATLGKDSSGNGNNWTPNNFSVTAGAGNDSLVDSPTAYGTDTGVGGEVRGNYATLNPLDKNSQIALANGNLDYTNSSSNANTQARATIAYPSSGKWYFESTRGSGGSSFAAGIGTSTTSLGTQNAGIIMYNEAGQIYVDGALNSTPGTTFASGNVMGVAVDMDASKVYWYKNGSVINASGLSFTIGSSTWMPMIGCYTNGDTGTLNFGQRPFAYTAPSGFKALVTTNLPTPTIGATSTTLAGKYFNPVLYTGNASSNAITGVGFKPDWIWIKSRSNGALNHALFDVLRGTPRLDTSATVAEGEFNQLNTYDTDGFTLKNELTVNQSGGSYVAWNWNAGGSTVTNTSGTISAQVRANTTSGFSIVTYTGTGSTGATVGHGLGIAPSMVIVKQRTDSGTFWNSYHISIGNGSAIDLNTTSAATASSFYWNNTSPTSSVFSISTNGTGYTNVSGKNYVAYCFAEIAGYSKFGSYTGNGAADGTFVYTNHRPAFLLVKRTDTTSNWTILDFQREGYNVDNDPLFPNLSDAEGTTDLADILSNGFKLRSTDASVNASGGTYIYMSVASNPFKYSLGR